MKAKNKK